MTTTHQQIMARLYGNDVWAGYEPGPQNAEVQGWNGTHLSLDGADLSAGLVAVDVGVWKGQSTITLAADMKRRGVDGCVIAVDTWLGSPEHWADSNALFRRHHGRPDLFQTFLTNVYHAGVADYIVPMPQTSVTAAMVLRQFGVSARIVHIDAAHEYEEVIRDAEEYWTVIAPGGRLIGDDYHESWPGVVRAAGEFSSRRMLPLTINVPKWSVTKPA